MPHRPSDAFIPYCLPSIDEDEIQEVVDTLRSGWLTTGAKTARFEKEFSTYVGAGYAIATNSCTAGLHLSVVALDIGPGDEVITSPLTFAATANVIVHCGATPVFADIEPSTYTLSVEDVEQKITHRTKAIIPVHYAGHPCRMHEIVDLAAANGLKVIEDAAHAVGTLYDSRHVGSIGDVTSFSFYATKNLTTGEGGMVTTDDESLAERIRSLSLHGLSADAWARYSQPSSWQYVVSEPGFKYNMADIQAALGLHQLRKLEQFTQRRRRIAETYRSRLGNLDLVLPVEEEYARHTYHLYPILVEGIERSDFIERMTDRGIGTSVHFSPLHLQPYYRDTFGYKKGDFPITEAIFARLVSLPLYPRMRDEDVERVSKEVIAVLTETDHQNGGENQ